MEEKTKVVQHLEKSKEEIYDLGVISTVIVDMIFRLKGDPETFNSDQSKIMFGLQTLVSNHLDKLSYEATMVVLDFDYPYEIENSFFAYVAKVEELSVMSKSVIDMSDSPQMPSLEEPVDSERAEMMFDLQIILSTYIRLFANEVEDLYFAFLGTEFDKDSQSFVID